MKALRIGLIILLIGAAAILVYWAVQPYSAPLWTGFAYADVGTGKLKAKTLWDWFELLLVPFFLAFGAWLLTASERESERAQQTEKHRQETLEKYFERVADLVVRQDRIQDSSMNGSVSLARIWSLTALRSLDGARKGELLQFLYEAGLIRAGPTIVLNGADLRASGLRHAVLQGSEIRGAYFNRSDMRDANLSLTDLRGSDLRGADLRGAMLEGANLSFALLDGANLANANLENANLLGTTLRWANLRGVRLSEEQVEVAILTGT